MDAKPVVLKSEGGSSSPFFQPKFNPKMLGIFAVVLVLVAGIGAGAYLIRSPLQLQPRAENPQPTIAPSFPSYQTAPPLSETVGTSGAVMASPASELPLPSDPGPTASASAQVNVYDFNNDSKVNSLDLSFMYANWGTPGTEEGKSADVNKDGVVNGVDFAMLLKEFN